MFRRSFVSLALAFCLLASVAPLQAAAQTQPAADTVLVLPFENASNQREYTWIAESFSEALTELLQGSGLVVLSDDERELAYQRLRIPLTVLPTRATAIRIAREAGATLVVLGTYSVTPSPADQTATALQGTARVIRVNEGRWMGETMPDGRWAWRPFDFGGQLRDLQRMQGRLAYDILYERDRALPFSLNQFMQRAERVPYRAFESYVKGIMTENTETRSAYLQNALREYANAHAGATYPQAAFALGQLYYAQNDWARAAEYFSRLQKRDPHYTEAAFYAALSYWRMNDLVRALGALLPLTTDVPLTGIYNNAGALSVQAARGERNATERERLLTQGVNFLRRAAESAPEDATVRFNYAYALFLKGEHNEAVEQLRPVITSSPQDGVAYFLFAKSLERTGRAEAATEADNQARRYYQGYARWQTEWQRSQTANEVPLRLRQEFNRLAYYDTIREQPTTEAAANTDSQNLMAKAQELYQGGRDDEALAELNQVLRVEPMNAAAYLLLGRINQRRGDLDKAIGFLRTAIFWDARSIDAHILLGRIFLERGDRAQAATHARNALQIDANNQEAIALQRQIQMGIR